MNRKMDQWIENHAVREHKEKHKILFYKATVDEYHYGPKYAEGAFPKKLIVEWWHLMTNGIFDENGSKVNVQVEEFTQSYPKRNVVNVNELWDRLLERNLRGLGLTKKFIKQVVVFLKKRKTNGEDKFKSLDHFIILYETEIEGTKRENETMLVLIEDLENDGKINFE